MPRLKSRKSKKNGLTFPEKLRKLTLWMGFCLILLPTFGCSMIVDRVVKHSTKQAHDISVFKGDLTAFRSCLHARGGACQGSVHSSLPGTATAGQATDGTSSANTTSSGKSTPTKAGMSPSGTASIAKLPDGHPAKLAHSALSHPALKQAVDLHNHLRGHGSGSLKVEKSENGGSKVHMPVSVSQSQDMQSKILHTSSSGGWGALHEHTKAQLAKSRPGDPGHEDRKHDVHRAKFIKKYVEAYFRNGHFIGVDFTIDESTAATDIANELSKHSKTLCEAYNARQSTDETVAQAEASTSCSGLATELYKAARGSTSNVDKHLLKISTQGFVSRDKSFSAAIPAFSIDVDPLAHHVVSDTHSQINFTQIGTDLVRVVLQAVFDAGEGLPALSGTTGSGLLPTLTQPCGHVDSEDLNAMTQINQQAAMILGIEVNRIIQGIGPLSLNNKAIESLVTTMVTTSVRKAVEKASWCWYACNLNVDIKTLEGDAKTDIEDKAKAEEEKARNRARKAEHEVALRLSVTK